MKPANKKRQGDPSLAVAYIRVSTQDQNLGPAAQRNAITQWAAANNVTVVSWRVDQGYSGALELDCRPGLLGVLEDLRAFSAGLVIVAKLDRLARDTFVACSIERAIKQCGGAKVVSAEGNNEDSASGAFMRQLLLATAQYERALIVGRTRSALAVKKARGEYVGNAPFGYEVGADGRTLVPNPREQTTLQILLKMRADGLSYRQIQHQAGQVSRTGRMLTLKSLYQILSRPQV